jgi:nucleotide sugar dehydrogenase
MKIAVFGMGKIGLPIALNFASSGAYVVGIDLQDELVKRINSGQEPFPGEKNLDVYLKKFLKKKNFYASTERVRNIQISDVIVICIPLIVDEKGNPIFENMDNLVQEIGSNISIGTLICFETTLPVGTTRKRFAKLIEELSGLTVGKDFYVVFSPERVFTGRVFDDLKRYPKLVGGVTEECTKRGSEFYGKVIKFDERPELSKPNGVWQMENAEAAEFAKIAETTYRDVNIGLANEFAILAKTENLNVLSVIEAANSQPYSHIHEPGISVGGHCIPVYSQFFMWGNINSQIVSAARKRNLSMPSRAVYQIKESIGSLNDLKIGILGITYRPNVKETSYSGAFHLLKILKEEGALVYALDPYYNNEQMIEYGFEGSVNLADMDGLILHTHHSIFDEIDFIVLDKLLFFYDGRKSKWKFKDSVRFKHITI